jgi:alpha-maltose-1-phosphate synthase
MNIVILTNEYPPYVYGGAGVHVEFLSRALADLENRAHRVKILCFGDQQQQAQNLTVEGVDPHFQPPFQDGRHQRFLETLERCGRWLGTLVRVSSAISVGPASPSARWSFIAK